MLSAKPGLSNTIPLYVDKQSDKSHENNRGKKFQMQLFISTTTYNKEQRHEYLHNLSSWKSTINVLSYKIIIYESI